MDNSSAIKYAKQLLMYRSLFYISIISMIYFVYVDKIALTALAMVLMIYADVLYRFLNSNTMLSMLYNKYLYDIEREKENAKAMLKFIEEAQELKEKEGEY